MKIYYRLSDSNRRGKAAPFFTNENCLNNFISNFKLNNSDKLIIIADNIEEKTEYFLKSLKIEYIKTSLGNSGSFDYALVHALNNCNDDDIIYFVENDYLHKKYSREVLDEAFEYFNADYVSLYDSPEKYEYHYNLNYNNFVDFSGDLFKDYKSKIYCGPKCYWRTSNSFTMTFAMKKELLRHDYEIFKYGLVEMDNKNYPYKKIPRDYEIFKILTNIKSRMLLTPMPGYATHGDLLSPHVDWYSIMK